MSSSNWNAPTTSGAFGQQAANNKSGVAFGFRRCSEIAGLMLVVALSEASVGKFLRIGQYGWICIYA